MTVSINGWEAPPDSVRRRLEFDDLPSSRLTHQLFRFPAKFHGRVVRQLLAEYTEPTQTVLDPFCGSGTLLVEAAVAGRSALGYDVDPLSVFMANVKSRALDCEAVKTAADELRLAIGALQRSDDEYRERMYADLTDEEYEREVGDFWVPTIPRLFHWFRRYVIVDLARLRSAIESLSVEDDVREFLLLVFASAIRGSSNADPVPVSGLERTSHMLARDEAGRLVNPFGVFERKLSRALPDLEEFQAARSQDAEVSARWADATETPPLEAGDRVDAVITSPPYHGAVDYYRRHQLEMFWLGLTETQEDRLKLLDRYLGRPHVPQKHRFVLNTDLGLWKGAAACEAAMRRDHPRRADEFRHYCVGMARVFASMLQVLPAGAPAIFVVGQSRWKGGNLDTTELFCELAGDAFVAEEQLWYPVKNRHMSYARHNGANIDREYVLVFRRRG